MSGQPNPTPPPAPTVNQPTPEEEARFRSMFAKMVSESGSGGSSTSVSTGQSQQQQSSGFEAAIEAVLARREGRQQRDKKLNELETQNTTLAGEVAELKKSLDELKQKPKRNIFSIFG